MSRSASLSTAFGFHLNLADKAERTLFIKDLAIAGALMVIAAHASVAPEAAGIRSITAVANR
jgi:putative oxidoreductase